MPVRKKTTKKSKTPKKVAKKTTKKKPAPKSTSKKGTPKHLDAKLKKAGHGPRFRAAVAKVFNESVSHIDELLPLVLTAASRAGAGTYVGVGLSALAMLSQNPVAKTAISMLIAKSKEVAHKYADDGVTFYRDITRDTHMFENAEEEINFERLRTPKTRRLFTRPVTQYPYRGVLGKTQRADPFSGPSIKRRRT